MSSARRRSPEAPPEHLAEPHSRMLPSFAPTLIRDAQPSRATAQSPSPRASPERAASTTPGEHPRRVACVRIVQPVAQGSTPLQAARSHRAMKAVDWVRRCAARAAGRHPQRRCPSARTPDCAARIAPKAPSEAEPPRVASDPMGSAVVRLNYLVPTCNAQRITPRKALSRARRGFAVSAASPGAQCLASVSCWVSCWNARRPHS